MTSPNVTFTAITVCKKWKFRNPWSIWQAWKLWWLNIILKALSVLRVVTIALHAITCCVCKSPVAIISLPVDILFLHSIVNAGNWFAHGCNYHRWWCRRWASPPGSCQSPPSPAVAQKGLGTPKYLSERGAGSKEGENKPSKKSLIKWNVPRCVLAAAHYGEI